MLFQPKTTPCCRPLCILAGKKVNMVYLRYPSVFFLLCMMTYCLSAQSGTLEESVLRLTGVLSVEQIDAEEMERYEKLHADPVNINMSSYSRLMETGLFTPYQLASLKDYRAIHGNVMSFRELSMLDGFSEDYVRMMMPFISTGASGMTSGMNDRLHHESTLRVGVKPSQLLYSFRYGVEKQGRFSCNIALNHSYGAPRPVPEVYNASVSVTSRSDRLRLILGSFNARFAQGLALWNGMSVGGLSTTSGFYKRQSGITPSSSFTGNLAFKGAALEIRCREWCFTLMDSFGLDGGFFMEPAVNISRTFRTGRSGVTHVASLELQDNGMRIPQMNTSVDIAWCLRGTDVFAELNHDWVSSKAAVLAGVVSPVSERMKIAAMLRYYPTGFSSGYASAHRSLTSCTNEYAVSLAGDLSLGRKVSFGSGGTSGSLPYRLSGHVSADMAHFPSAKAGDNGKSVQVKLATTWSLILSRSVKIGLKVSEKVRTWGRPFRTAVRADFNYSSGCLDLIIRADMTRCVSTGQLAGLEGGYRSEKIAAYLRQGIFFVDDWDDRIYVYERDAPGNFSVPAFYGRGVWTSFCGRWKPAGWVKLYLRASMTLYPFMSPEKKKPGRAELKLQTVFSF